MLEIFLIAIALVGISFVILGFNIFFRKNKKFPETEIGHNKKMREQGIFCVKCEEKKSWKRYKRSLKYPINPNKLMLDMNEKNPRHLLLG